MQQRKSAATSEEKAVKSPTVSVFCRAQLLAAHKPALLWVFFLENCSAFQCWNTIMWVALFEGMVSFHINRGKYHRVTVLNFMFIRDHLGFDMHRPECLKKTAKNVEQEGSGVIKPTPATKDNSAVLVKF